MTSLTTKENSFMAMMGNSDEHTRKGFELILKRPYFPKFFDALFAQGFFDPAKNPAPVTVQPDGHIHIPYWKALDYLKACARVAGHDGDAELGDKVMTVVRTVSTASRGADSRHNHLTFWAFSEIIGALPIASIASQDLHFVQDWLNTKYNRFMVAHALDEGALRRLLASDDPAAWTKAVELIGYCTAIRWKPSRFDPETDEPGTIADKYYVKEMIDHHGTSLGNKVGLEAATLFAGRVAEAFGRGGRAQWSHVFRPAVEDDDQNPKGASIDCVVDGLRDVLLGWCDSDVRTAKPFVASLLHEQSEMLRRIGIFVVNRRWAHLKELYRPVVSPELFDFGHLHELYLLLRDRFETFSNEDKEATVNAIRDISVTGADGSGTREILQRHWLSALAGTTYDPASRWLADLTTRYGPEPNHAEYLSFTETRWGPGPSPYSAQELIALAAEGTIVDKLCAFRPGDPWHGPTLAALIHELHRAVKAAPDHFANAMREFPRAPRHFQYGLLHGFWLLFRDAKGLTPAPEETLWHSLFEFFEQLLRDPQFWEVLDNTNREAQPSRVEDAIADLLDHGARDGAHGYPSSLLPRAWSVVQDLVEHANAATEPSADAMSQAINSSKGRALGAAFSHILRRFRSAAKTADSHTSVWAEVRPFLDHQLAQCTGTNFEFSTLCGTHIRNLQWFDAGWLTEHIRDIFPVVHPGNFRSALAGLAYASVTQAIYRMLRDKGIMDQAMGVDIGNSHTRERLMEMLALAYLWGDDTLESPRFDYLFVEQRSDDLESINHFLPTIRDSALECRQVERVVDYWRRCVRWAQSRSEPPVNLLSSLSGLTAFLTTAEGNLDLLSPVAAHVHVHRNAYEFIRELNRLVKVSPRAVRSVVAKFIDTHEPFHDYENGMQTLVQAIAERGFRADAIDFCNKLRAMPGMAELFEKLTRRCAG